MTGKLILIPINIAEGNQKSLLTEQVKNELKDIRFFLAENIRTARRYLSSLQIYDSIETLDFQVLDKDTSMETVRTLMKPMLAGHTIGVLSESGCPGIADPGALAVRVAHEHSIKVVPLVGPSSILLALMASGLNGQRFAFQGYLPVETQALIAAIKDFERESRQKNQTQIFIETPYRNKSLLHALLKNLSGNTLLTVALDITGADEFIRTASVKKWQEQTIEVPKLPAVYLFLAH
jgi:16S rRNA (cytidine1402-2'-O)-methyltransferase